MHILNTLLAAVGLPWLAAAAYLLLTTCLWRRPADGAACRRFPHFAIVVPAHNEERGIGDTIASLRALDYPTSRVRLVVVADNCTDGTARIAAGMGAEVIVRADADRRGKGYALQMAIETLLADNGRRGQWDALAVVDADTVLSPNFLRACAARIEAGESAVQAAYLPRRSDSGPMAVVTEVALVAFHLVRSAARERLGLSCGLRGNGMAFTRDLLQQVPHTAFSRTEDLEFGVQLGLRGVRVAFAGDAHVYGDMPERSDVVSRQRERWIGGRFTIARRFFIALLRAGMSRRSVMPVDLAVDLVVPPLSVMLVVLSAGLGASGLLACALNQLTASVLVWGLGFAGLVLHVGHAARLAGRGTAFVYAARVLPSYALGKTMIAIRALKPSEERWTRTLREGEGA